MLPSMAAHPASTASDPSFALGLTPADVEEFRTILREDCVEDLSLPQAWRRAAQVLALFHYLLQIARDSETEAGARTSGYPLTNSSG